jgi:predicted FMN-binding regulatory protein PaiB
MKVSVKSMVKMCDTLWKVMKRKFGMYYWSKKATLTASCSSLIFSASKRAKQLLAVHLATQQRPALP